MCELHEFFWNHNTLLKLPFNGLALLSRDMNYTYLCVLGKQIVRFQNLLFERVAELQTSEDRYSEAIGRLQDCPAPRFLYLVWTRSQRTSEISDKIARVWNRKYPFREDECVRNNFRIRRIWSSMERIVCSWVGRPGLLMTQSLCRIFTTATCLLWQIDWNTTPHPHSPQRLYRVGDIALPWLSFYYCWASLIIQADLW